MRARPETIQWLTRYYALVDAGDVDGAAAFFADDATMRIAHGRPVTGREAIAQRLRAGLQAVAGFRHQLKDVWEEDGVVVFEVDVTYTRLDGRVVVIPGSAFCSVSGGLFTAQRLYADFGPVFR